MTRRCELTGKLPMAGNLRSHAENKTRRVFRPNLVEVTLISDQLQRKVRLRISAHALKTLEHRGGDPRVEELVRLGLPAVIVGGPVEGGALPAVWHDEKTVVVDLVRYLAALGHTRVARVAGVAGFVHSTIRTAIFEEVTSDLELSARVISTDYTPESGARATRQLLSDPEPPTAIAYDSDVLAVTGLGVAQQMGFSVPGDVSIVAWDDSLLCQVVHPPLTTVSRDISEYGALACKRLLAAIEDPDDTADVEAPRGELTTRASTGPAPTPRLRSPRVA